jgi:hypothetical protein
MLTGRTRQRRATKTMPTVEDLPISDILEVLAPTFRTLDVRAFAAKQGDRWTVVAATVVATHAAADTVETQHTRLRKGLLDPHPRARFFFEALAASELPALLSAVEGGTLRVAGQNFDLEQPVPVRDQPLRHRAYLTLSPEDRRFRRYSFGVPLPQSPDRSGRAAETDPLAAAGVRPSDLQLCSWQDANHWLGMAMFNQDGRRALSLNIVLPVYAWFRPTPTLAGTRVGLAGVCHGALQGKLSARVFVRGQNSEVRDSAVVRLQTPTEPNGLNDVAFGLPFEQAQFAAGDRVEVRVYHDDLGDLDLDAQVQHTYLRGEHPDPLGQALVLFNAGQRIAASLGARGQGIGNAPPVFDAAVAALFGLLLQHVVPLFADRSNEGLSDDGVTLGSADVLAHDDQVGLVVVDFTRAVPLAEKAERLRQTAIFLGERVGVPVRAVICSPSTLPMLQREWAQYGVTVLDGPRLKQLWALVQAGNVAGARSEAVRWISDVPAVGEA